MNPILLLLLGLDAFVLTSWSKPTAAPGPIPSGKIPLSIQLPPGTLIQTEVDLITNGTPTRLYQAAMQSRHKLFVGAAATKLATLGDNRSKTLAKRFQTLPDDDPLSLPAMQGPHRIFQTPEAIAQTAWSLTQEFQETPTITHWVGPSKREYLVLYWSKPGTMAELLYTESPETAWGAQSTTGQVPVLLINLMPDNAAQEDIARFVVFKELLVRQDYKVFRDPQELLVQ